MSKTFKISKSGLTWGIPALFGIVIGALSIFPDSDMLQYAVYDNFLKLKAPVSQDPRVLLVDIDDTSIQHIGSYPWPRDLIADAVLGLAEYGARSVVFDIEYLEKSPPGINLDYLTYGLPTDFNDTWNALAYKIEEYAGTGEERKGPTAREALQDLVYGVNSDIMRLKELAGSVARDTDVYFSQAIRLFGDVFMTLHYPEDVLDATETDEERVRLVEEEFAYPVSGYERVKLVQNRFWLPIMPLLRESKGIGFTNVSVDPDGKRRRIPLVLRVRDRTYLQLALRPVMDYMGDPALEVKSDRIEVRGAKIDGKTVDFSIPLDEAGNMIIFWPAGPYRDAFKPHLSIAEVIETYKAENLIAKTVAQLAAQELWRKAAPLSDGAMGDAETLSIGFSELAKLKAEMLESGSREDFDFYVEAKAYLFSLVEEFIAADPASGLRDVVDKVKMDATGDQLVQLEKETEAAERLVADIGNFYGALATLRSGLEKAVKDKLCIIGWTASTTTDMGATPFESRYVNVGTHAAIMNMVLGRVFIAEAPRWISSLLALLLPLALVWFIRNAKPLVQIGTGFGAALLLVVAAFGFFALTGIYVKVLLPAVSIFMSFLVYALVEFFSTEREKSFLRKAFSTYLSGEVINQLLSNPENLKLGGQEKHMTALFTDVKGFSTISEALTAEQLVHLLNIYLSEMSDIVLNNAGTIDKYEGDAIIGFFGAPLDFPGHARAACKSAVEMKKAETLLNQRLLAEELTPTPLLTRVGINTGSMVAGNMGTERKMNYTIMGSAVNLAARLEGVNKQYGTWILTTDATKKEAGDEFVFRRLDRVRVVGITTPVELFEVVGFAADLGSEDSAYYRGFDSALDLFRQKDWKRAKEAFSELAIARPADGPNRTYIKKCDDFLAKPPAESWDGVFNLTEK